MKHLIFALAAVLLFTAPGLAALAIITRVQPLACAAPMFAISDAIGFYAGSAAPARRRK